MEKVLLNTSQRVGGDGGEGEDGGHEGVIDLGHAAEEGQEEEEAEEAAGALRRQVVGVLRDGPVEPQLHEEVVEAAGADRHHEDGKVGDQQEHVCPPAAGSSFQDGPKWSEFFYEDTDHLSARTRQ